MADVVTPAIRSRMMSGIRGKNTKPELLLRRELHRRGYRYRLYNKDLPGRPDLVLPKHNAVIFSHGCLWHRHECHLFKWPCVDNPQKAKFWREKINGNCERDSRQLAELQNNDWRVAVVWECATKGKFKIPVVNLVDSITDWLLSDTSFIEINGIKQQT